MVGGVAKRKALEAAGIKVKTPELPVGYEWHWLRFWELSSGRQHSANGPLPLSWADISAWSELMGETVEPDDLVIFRAMDAAFIEWAAKGVKNDGS